MHPWALRAPPADGPEDALVIGVYLHEHHVAWPWPEVRWNWVDTAMAAVAPQRWWVDAAGLATALAGAARVRSVDNRTSALAGASRPPGGRARLVPAGRAALHELFTMVEPGHPWPAPRRGVALNPTDRSDTRSTVLYDGECPLCRREIAHVKGLAERRSDTAVCSSTSARAPVQTPA